MSYQEDVRFVGAFLRGGDWEVGLRIARNVDPTTNGDPGEISPGRVSLRAFAKDAGVDKNTIAKYLATWELAAADKVVDPSAELEAGTEYDWQISGYTQADWAGYYRRAVQLPPPWNPKARALEPRTGAERHIAKEHVAITPEKVAEAVKTDPAVRLAAREAISQADKQHKPVDPKGKQDSPIEQFGRLHVELRSAKRSLTEALGYVIDMRGVTDADEVRAAVSGYVTQLRHVLELIDEAAQGKSLDDELAQLLAEDGDLR